MFNMHRKDAIAQIKIQEYRIVILGAFCILSYFPSLVNGFTTWDDPLYVLENPYIKSLSVKNIVAIFSSFELGI